MASLLKVGAIWYGRHIYTDETGKRREKRKSFDTPDKGRALKRLAKWESEIEAKRWGESAPMLFVEASQRFINEHCPTIAKASSKRYETSIKQLRRHLGGKMLHEIAAPDLLAFEMARRKDPGRYAVGKTDETGKRKKARVTTSSIRRDLNCLSSIIGYGLEAGWLPVTHINPVGGFLKRRKNSGNLREGKPRTRYLTEAEEARLIAAIRSGPRANTRAGKTLLDIVRIAIGTGARLGELVSMKWSDVQLQDPASVFIVGNVREADRTAPLFDDVRDVVRGLNVAPDGKFLFWRKARNGRAMPLKDVKKGFHAACARAGLPDVEFHDLRRTCGCRLLQKHKLPMVEVSKWLGHSSVSVTENHYAFLDDGTLHGAVERDRERRASEPTQGATIIPMRALR